jgi:hypothetical protein
VSTPDSRSVASAASGPPAPLVSIILTTYNARDYLPATLASVLAQSYPHFELLVVDDGSTDGSEEVYAAVAARDSRVRPFHQANQGPSAGRNLGLREARGELIGFLDSDDLLHPDFLRRLVDALTTSGADIAVCNSAVFPDGQQPQLAAGAGELRRLDRDTALRALLAGELVPNVWNRLYRRALFDGVPFDPELYNAEDLEITVRLLLRSRLLAWLPVDLHAYRKRAGSILSTPRPKLLADRLAVVGKVRRNLADAGLAGPLEGELRTLAARHLAYYGMKDMVRSPAPDWSWFARMRRCLREDCGVGLATVGALPLSGKARKWVRLALLPLPVGRAFLTYQHWRAHR